MRKVIATLILILTFFITYLLQVNFFSWFTIAGIKPNLFIILTLFVSLFSGTKVGIPYGIIIGLFCDILLGKNIGINAVMLGIIAFIAGYLDKNFSKESRITIMLMVMGITCFFEIGSYIMQIVELSILIEPFPFFITLLIEIFYNAIVTIILYPIMQKIGHYLEETFKEPKILTTYF